MEVLNSLIPKQSPVTLVANDTLPDKPLITPLMTKDGTQPRVDSNGNPLGSIRLQQYNTKISGTFVSSGRRTAFMTSTIAYLQTLLDTNKLTEGSKIAGKIQVVESLNPLWPNQQPKVNPQSGEQVGVTVDGTFYPVYMQQRYTEDKNAKDTFISTPEDGAAWLMSHAVMAEEQNTAKNEAAGVPQG